MHTSKRVDQSQAQKHEKVIIKLFKINDKEKS